MLSYYASAQLSTDQELEQEIDLINHNPVIDTVLMSTNGLVAVLNENRQVLSVNTILLDQLGINNEICIYLRNIISTLY